MGRSFAYQGQEFLRFEHVKVRLFDDDGIEMVFMFIEYAYNFLKSELLNRSDHGGDEVVKRLYVNGNILKHLTPSEAQENLMVLIFQKYHNAIHRGMISPDVQFPIQEDKRRKKRPAEGSNTMWIYI